jgi:neutral ceramidase
MTSAALAAVLVAGLGAQEIALRAGLARTDITPSTFGPMYGYANRRCGPANGTNDRLYAKALVLESGGSAMAIVTLDLGSMVSKTLFRRAAEELKIPLLLLAASHTHSAPAFLPMPATGSASAEPSPYLAEVEAKIFDTVARASQSMFPARLSAGRGSIQLGYNRLLLRDDGRARALFDNLERIPYGPVDPEFVLLRVSDDQGSPRALLVHYAAHAVVLGPTSCKYSADYPGVLQARVEESIPGVQAMFVQGGAGDINPLFQGRTGNEEADFATMRKMGEALAAVVLGAAKNLSPVARQDGPIRHVTETFTAADRWEKGRTHEIGISTVLVNRELAIAAVPGEAFHKLQTDWKRRAEVKYPLFYGYTQTTPNPWPGYIPDLRSAARGGYGADANTRVEVGTGERIVDRHVINLYGLRGMWRDQPGRP